MRLFVVVLAFLVGCGIVAAEPFTAVPDRLHIFIPVGIYYMHGSFVKIVPFDQEPIAELSLCRNELQGIIEKIKIKGGDMPEGGDVIAACMPVLATIPVR
jgi:hypothetical protein